MIRVSKQASWYINPATGSDRNTGADSGSPLKTWFEVLRRVPEGRFAQDTTFYIQSDMGDPVDISMWSPDRRYSLTFQGTRTVIASGTLSAATTRDPATRQLQTVTSADVTWSSYVSGGYAIVFTSGAASGMLAYIAEDLGGNEAVISTPFTSTTGQSEAAPAMGDTFDIVKLVTAADSNLSADNYGRALIVYNIDFYDTSPSVNHFSTSGINFRNCRFYNMPYVAGFVRYYNCCFQIVQGYGGFALFWAGMAYQGVTKNTNECEYGQQFQIANGMLFYGCSLSAINGGFLRIYDAAIHNADSHAIDLHAGGKLRAEVLSGDGNGGYGVNTNGSGIIMYDNTPTLTLRGDSGDVRLNQTDVTWATALSNGKTEDSASAAMITPY